MSFSVILPTLNEKGHILKLINEISYILTVKKVDYEIIIVDDNSSDGTFKLVNKFKRKKKFIKCILRKNLRKNLPNSINDGIKISKYENIIWLDADFQHPPRYIKKFIDLSKKFDVIIASRFLKKSNRYFNNKRFKKKLNENQSYFYNKLCQFFLFKDITDYTSGFICIKKNILKKYFLNGYYGDYFVSLVTFVKKKNKSIKEIPYKDSVRATGFSKTVVNLNLKYLYTCCRYFLTLLVCYLKLKFS